MGDSKLSYLFLFILSKFLWGWDCVWDGLRECCGLFPRLYNDLVDHECELVMGMFPWHFDHDNDESLPFTLGQPQKLRDPFVLPN